MGSLFLLKLSLDLFSIIWYDKKVGDTMVEKNKVVSEPNEMLSKIDAMMRQDSKDRKQILKSVEKDLAEHSKKLVEYDQTAKAYKLLEVKYNILKKEHDENVKFSSERIETLKTINDEISEENKILKKVVMNQKRKISGLQSIVELMVKDYGIANIEVVTGLSSEKIKEYFQD